MPLYGTIPVPALSPGDSFTAFNAETVTAPQASAAVAMAYKEGAGVPQVAVSIQFASAPTAVVEIQTSNTDVDADYVTVSGSGSTNTSPDILQLPIAAAFVRAYVASQSQGGAVTVEIRRAS
jgi:hypothetical protein